MSSLSPNFVWPGGHRAAVSLIIHVPGVTETPDSTSHADLVGLDYTTAGLTRIFDLLADLDVPATVAFTADTVNEAPELVRLAQAFGHEIAASACSQSGSTEDLFENLADLIGERVNGLVEQLPGFQSSESDEEFGNDSGKAWRITGRSADLPLAERDGQATIIPVSPYTIDTAWLSPSRPLPPSSLQEAWSLELAGHRSRSTFMPVVIHPHIMGRPGLTGTLERFLDEVIASGDVWLARLDHVAVLASALANAPEE